MALCNHFYTLCAPSNKNESKFEGAAWVGVVPKVQVYGEGDFLGGLVNPPKNKSAIL